MPLDVREDVRPLDHLLQLLRLQAPLLQKRKRLLGRERPFGVRQLPEAREQPRIRPPPHGVPAAAGEEKDGQLLLPPGLFGLLDGKRLPAAVHFRPAEALQRAKGALRRAVRHAHARAELHERLRQLTPAAGVFLIDRAEQQLIAFFDALLRHGRRVLRHACEHAQHVPVDRGRGPVKADRGDRARRIVSHTGQRPDRRIVRGEDAPVLRDDHLRRLLQVAHAGVVAKALPELREPPLFARGERGDIGQLRKEAGVVAPDGLHARLLEHDLRQPDMIRLPVLPPGQIPVAGRVPAQQQGRKGLRQRMGHRSGLLSGKIFWMYCMRFPRACQIAGKTV